MGQGTVRPGLLRAMPGTPLGLTGRHGTRPVAMSNSPFLAWPAAGVADRASNPGSVGRPAWHAAGCHVEQSVLGTACCWASHARSVPGPLARPSSKRTQLELETKTRLYAKQAKLSDDL